MKVRLTWLAALVLAAAPLGAAAQTDIYVKRGTIQRQERVREFKGSDFERQGYFWVEEAECGAAVKEGARLIVRVDMGGVKVRPGASDKMECRVRLGVSASSEQEARRLLSGFALSVNRASNGGVYLGGTAPSDSAHQRAWMVNFDIQVPLRFNVDIETQGGGIEVERLDGELRAATAGGDIRAGDLTGPARLETAGGAITLQQVGGRVEARTAGGEIRVGDVKGDAILETSGGEIRGGRIAGTVRASTAGGDIALAGADGDIIAETAGGQIRIGASGGSVRAETAGGSIRLEGARGPVRVQTAGGSIDLYRMQSGVEAVTTAGSIQALIAASRESFRPSLLKTSFGDVQVYLPPELPFTIEATIEMAGGHKILTDFPLNIQGEEAGYQPTTLQGRGQVNGGGQVLRIRTVAGNIEIRRLDAQVLERLEQRQKLLQERQQKRNQRRQQNQREQDEEPQP